MDKVLSTANGNIIITNNGATILDKVQLMSPFYVVGSDAPRLY
jgi:chaperonin GroEL (HSP60 family)